MSRLMLVGATGLVGGHVLQQALVDPRVTQVVAPTRRPLPSHPKLLNPVVDFRRLPAQAEWWAVDALVCTLGTTLRQAGSQQAFYQVDHDAVLEVAYLARRHGTGCMAFNSALGADAASRVFYSRTKGETERDLQAVGFASLSLVRPGLIGGARAESRPLERLAVAFTRLLQPLLPRRWRVVPAESIARHLLRAALQAQPGVHVLPSEVLLQPDI